MYLILYIGLYISSSKTIVCLFLPEKYYYTAYNWIFICSILKKCIGAM